MTSSIRRYPIPERSATPVPSKSTAKRSAGGAAAGSPTCDRSTNTYRWANSQQSNSCRRLCRWQGRSPISSCLKASSPEAAEWLETGTCNEPSRAGVSPGRPGQRLHALPLALPRSGGVKSRTASSATVRRAAFSPSISRASTFNSPVRVTQSTTSRRTWNGRPAICASAGS